MPTATRRIPKSRSPKKESRKMTAPKHPKDEPAHKAPPKVEAKVAKVEPAPVVAAPAVAPRSSALAAVLAKIDAISPREAEKDPMGALARKVDLVVEALRALA